MIELSEVFKRYGRKPALDSVTLQIEDKGIYCLIGRDGAGKSTLLKLIAGHIRPSAGKIAIDKVKISPLRAPSFVNFLSGDRCYFNLRVSELINTVSIFKNNFDSEYAMDITRRWRIDPSMKYDHMQPADKIILPLILALASDSKVILLDEAALSTDLETRQKIAVILEESRRTKPRIIIAATRFIDEIAYASNKIIIIEKGCVLLTADMSDIDERAYTLIGPIDIIPALVKNLNCVGKSIVGNRLAAHIYDDRVELPVGVELEPLCLKDLYIIAVLGGGGHGKRGEGFSNKPLCC